MRISDWSSDVCSSDLLRDEVFWSVRGRSRALIGRLYVGDISGEPLQLLERWREKFGGTIEATGEKYTDNWAWYALATAVGGVPVTLLVPVEQPEVEQQLRARLVELAAAITEHHQPVPPVLPGRETGRSEGRG